MFKFKLGLVLSILGMAISPAIAAEGWIYQVSDQEILASFSYQPGVPTADAQGADGNTGWSGDFAREVVTDGILVGIRTWESLNRPCAVSLFYAVPTGPEEFYRYEYTTGWHIEEEYVDECGSAPLTADHSEFGVLARYDVSPRFNFMKEIAVCQNKNNGRVKGYEIRGGAPIRVERPNCKNRRGLWDADYSNCRRGGAPVGMRLEFDREAGRVSSLVGLKMICRAALLYRIDSFNVGGGDGQVRTASIDGAYLIRPLRDAEGIPGFPESISVEEALQWVESDCCTADNWESTLGVNRSVYACEKPTGRLICSDGSVSSKCSCSVTLGPRN